MRVATNLKFSFISDGDVQLHVNYEWTKGDLSCQVEASRVSIGTCFGG